MAVMAVTAVVVLAEDFLTGIAAGLLLHCALDVASTPPPPSGPLSTAWVVSLEGAGHRAGLQIA